MRRITQAEQDFADFGDNLGSPDATTFVHPNRAAGDEVYGSVESLERAQAIAVRAEIKNAVYDGSVEASDETADGTASVSAIVG